MSTGFRELEDELDFEFWLEREGVSYKLTRGKSGMQANLRECPACGDRRYRAYLNAESGRGNCFVCNETFKGKLDFIKKQTGLSFRDALANITETLKDQGWRPKRTAVAVEEEKATLPLSFPLPTPSGENLIYLEDRGIGADIAGYLGLRYSEFGVWNFTKEDGTKGTQNFANRVIIPVYDLNGTFVTFQGRDVSGLSDRKYLFPKGLPGTGRYLLNGQNAKRTKRVAMGEGVFDVAGLKMAMDGEIDLRDVVPVGSFGKNLSYGSPDGNDQLGRFLELKREGLEEVTIMWDGEEKALVAALDAAKMLTRCGFRVKIALLPAGCDPNEVLPEVVRDCFRKAQLYTKALDVRWRLRNPYKGTGKKDASQF